MGPVTLVRVLTIQVKLSSASPSHLGQLGRAHRNFQTKYIVFI